MSQKPRAHPDGFKYLSIVKLSEKIIDHSNNVVNDSISENGLILRYIRLLAKRRMLWLHHLWSGENQNGERQINHEIYSYLSIEDLPGKEWSWQTNNPETRILNAEIKDLESALLNSPHSRINKLIRLFNLNKQEQAILYTCFAISLEPNLSRVFAYLNDHSGRDYVNEGLVSRLFGFGRHLSIDHGSPLFYWHIVHEIPNASSYSPILRIDRYIRSWILGNNVIDPDLSNVITPVTNHPPLSNWPVQEYVNKISLNIEHGLKVRLLVSAEKGNGRKSFAANISTTFNKKLYTLKSGLFHNGRIHSLEKNIQRQLILDDALFCNQIEHREDMTRPINHPYFDLTIFISTDKKIPFQLHEKEIEEIVLLPGLSLKDRKKFFEENIPETKNWSKELCNKVLNRQHLSIDQLNRIKNRPTISEEKIKQELNGFELKGIEHLLQHISCNFSLNDLIVSTYVKDAIHDFMFEALDRIPLWEKPSINRLFPYGKGLFGLFSGPPGTGKTMAAQVIANELGLDIYRINLANVVNKYVGESSKNMERILKIAQHNNAIILIDEADALFGKRTDVNSSNDRFANTETNYLLQAIEQYPGILILSTNKRENIDPGFFRRFRYNIVFPIPDAKTRYHLWHQLSHEMAGEIISENIGQKLQSLADLVELTGAQIKQSILSAIYLSRKEEEKLNIHHLVAAVERELTKDSRGLERKIKSNLLSVS